MVVAVVWYCSLVIVVVLVFFAKDEFVIVVGVLYLSVLLVNVEQGGSW